MLRAHLHHLTKLSKPIRHRSHCPRTPHRQLLVHPGRSPRRSGHYRNDCRTNWHSDVHGWINLDWDRVAQRWRSDTDDDRAWARRALYQCDVLGRCGLRWEYVTECCCHDHTDHVDSSSSTDFGVGNGGQRQSVSVVERPVVEQRDVDHGLHRDNLAR